jgi:hypothetical protein
MDSEPSTVNNVTENLEFAEPDDSPKLLELLRDTEALLRRPTVATLVPILSPNLANKLQAASQVAEDSLKDLASIDNSKSEGSFNGYDIIYSPNFLSASLYIV